MLHACRTPYNTTTLWSGEVLLLLLLLLLLFYRQVNWGSKRIRKSQGLLSSKAQSECQTPRLKALTKAHTLASSDLSVLPWVSHLASAFKFPLLKIGSELISYKLLWASAELKYVKLFVFYWAPTIKTIQHLRSTCPVPRMQQGLSEI